jgi:predicted acyltransferase
MIDLIKNSIQNIFIAAVLIATYSPRKNILIAAVLIVACWMFLRDCRNDRWCEHGDINGNKPPAEYCIGRK